MKKARLFLAMVFVLVSCAVTQIVCAYPIAGVTQEIYDEIKSNPECSSFNLTAGVMNELGRIFKEENDKVESPIEQTKEKKIESSIEQTEEKKVEVWGPEENFYTTSVLNIRKDPDKESDKIGELPWNTRISGCRSNIGWVKLTAIEGNKANGYVCTDYVSYEGYEYKDKEVPQTTGWKTYMPYTSLTLKRSPQWKLQSIYSYTGDYGIRMVDDRYCIALGSYFTSDIGTYVDLILENGTVIPCVLADQKADCDTDEMNVYTLGSGCVSEFVIDLNSLDKRAKISGNMSSCTEKWNSKVKTIRIYDKKIDVEWS